MCADWRLNLNRKIIVAGLMAMLLLGACTGQRKVVDDGTTGGEGIAADTASDAQSSGVASVVTGGAGSQGGALGPQGALASQRVIYFDFDSSDIRTEFVDVLAAHGSFLARNPAVRVRLEGHTDERGSREYNIGLAERRAQTVRRALVLQGVLESQVSTVSYGEERPAAAGSDERAWALNRRVEIVYIN
jgi:peptidoglycan-associated lipoprotein